MARGFVISLVLHLGLLAWALIGFAATRPLPSEDIEPVEVSIISVQDLVTRQKQGDVTSKVEEAAPPPKPSPVVAAVESPKPAPAPPPPPAAAPPPPAPEPAKVEAPPPPAPKAEPPPPAPDQIALAIAKEEDLRKAEAEAAAKAAAEAKAKADAEAKARAEAEAKAKAKAIADAKAKAIAKAKADAAKKAAEAKAKTEAAKAASFEDLVAKSIEGATEKPELLDKDPRKKAGGAQSPQTVASAATAKGPTAGSPTGRDQVNTARDEDMLRALIRQALASCWRLPTAGGDSRTIPVVKLSWRMRPDGSLDGEPKVVAREESPIGVVAADAAVRAVQSCRFGLPADKYALWREIDWTFDPRRP